jgi:hypothetical protein
VDKEKDIIQDIDIIKHHLGELTEDRDQKVREWAFSHPKNTQLYKIYQIIIKSLDSIYPIKQYSIKKAWLKIMGR